MDKKLLVRIVIFGLIHQYLTAITSAAELPIVAPQAIIDKYGKPDITDSTEFDKPRPPFVTKFLIYKKERVRFVFLADAPMDSPPPYKRWRFMGMQDPKSNAVLDADEVKKRMAGRIRN